MSLEQAREAMNVIAAGYRQAHPTNVDAPSQIEVVPLLEDAVGQQRRSYLMLFGAVGCVLLIACANIANLLLARFAARRKEIAARFALGANRLDVVLQLVTESMLVAVLGGAVGLLLASVALKVIVTSGADLIPRAIDIRLDPTALVFTIVVTLVTGLAIGLLARAAGVCRQRAGDAQGSEPRIHGHGSAPARESARRRSVALRRAARRRELAAGELRAAPARGAGIQA